MNAQTSETPAFENPCPTPQKIAYTVRRVAKAAAVEHRKTLKIRLRVYVCECGKYHLTKATRRGTPSIPENMGVAQLLALRDAEIAILARYEIIGRLTADKIELLRHPDVLERWAAALKLLQAEILADFARVGDNTGGVASEQAVTRKDAMLAQVAQRRSECRRLISRNKRHS